MPRNEESFFFGVDWINVLRMVIFGVCLSFFINYLIKKI